MRKPLLSKKVQVLVTDEQFAILQHTARREGKKLGTVLRDAFDRVYVRRHREAQVRSACARLLSLKAPATDWADFEADYVAHKSGGRR